MTIKEITDIVYDTLMGNIATPHNVYEPFDLSRVENQEVDAAKGLILFDYDGETFRLILTGRM